MPVVCIRYLVFPTEPKLTEAAQGTKVCKAVAYKLADEVILSVLEMYHAFRARFPELTQAADTKHIKVWDSVDDETAYCWFESLAGAINDEMGKRDESANLTSVFSFFDRQLRGSDTEVKNCIDVSLVENLFWQVQPCSAARAWESMPTSMQQLYLKFHGQLPTTG